MAFAYETVKIPTLSAPGLVVAGLGAETFRRYTAEFEKQDAAAAYSVWVNNTVAKRIRLRNLRIEKR